MKHLQPWVVLAGLFVVCLSANTGRAASNHYVESFATTTFKDVANTTALWDTGAGVLKLNPFVGSLVGTYNTTGTATHIAVAGDLAFVADDVSGLQIINITNPVLPTLAGTYNTPGTAMDVAVAGDLAFVADGSFGLQIVNITNPVVPTLTGTYNTPGTSFDVAVAGDLAVVADGFNLLTINIANPAAPTLTGTYVTVGVALGVVLAGDLAFVADSNAGLQVVNITNPALPTLVGGYDTPGPASGVAVTGDLALVADGIFGVQIINVTNPSSPTLVSTYNTPGSVNGVGVAGDLALVGDGTSGLQVINIANPAIPVLIQTYDTPGNASGVTLSGEHAFVGDGGSGLQVVSVTAPGFPTLVGTYNQNPQNMFDVTVAGDLAFFADEIFGLRIFNVINPASPIPTGTYDTPGAPNGVAVAGDLAFVADRSSGLQIINIINPAVPTLTGSYNTPGTATDVVVAGDLAFVADDVSGLQIINITNPAVPTLTGSYNTPGTATDVVVAGDLALVADGTSGLQIINITNPAVPTLTGSYNTPGTANAIAVAGDLAFVADDVSGLQIINITNPAVPTLAGTYDTPANAVDVAVSGDFVFVADYTDGLLVINAANPASPTLAGAYDAAGSAAFGVAVAGELVYEAEGFDGFRVVQVFNHDFYTRNNRGQSIPVDGANEQILRARLSSTRTADVSIELSADAGSNWREGVIDNVWTKMTVPGTDLVWRATLTVATPGQTPTLSDLQIDWRDQGASIAAITDIPGDQGGWVRLQVLRSGLDFADELSLPIVHYGVWRRVDSAALATRLAVPGTMTGIEPSVAESYATLPIFGYDHRVFIQSAPGPMAATFPPGMWELVQTIPALQQDVYLAAIPTEADSTVQGMHFTAVVVTAHTTTPSVWYASPPDSGYSLDNIAPAVPANFAIAYNTGSGNTLSWNPSPDDDFQYFRVYRSTDPNFVISLGTLVHATTTTGWADPDYDGGAIYYKVTALDYAGNESDPATAGLVTSVGGAAVPERAALYQNHPNPFNPTTLIRYDVPRGGADVRLSIYDVSGRLVRTLVSERESAGGKTIRWDGRDDAGSAVSTGIYFYRIAIGGFTATRKMALLK